MSNPLFADRKRYIVQYLRPHKDHWIIWETDRLESALALFRRAKRKGWRVGSDQGVYDRAKKCFVAPPSKSQNTKTNNKRGRHL